MDLETVDKIARLARLELSVEERRTLAEQLGEVIDYVRMLAELDTDEVRPFMHAAEGLGVFREDEPAESLTAEDALANAPERKGDFFRVPRVVEGA